jgi:hypothetical protein
MLKNQPHKEKTMSEKTCLICGRNSDEIPLLTFEYRAEIYHLCPQCLPVMIHKPQNLVGKLPGAENFSAANHDH